MREGTTSHKHIKYCWNYWPSVPRTNNSYNTFILHIVFWKQVCQWKRTESACLPGLHRSYYRFQFPKPAPGAISDSLEEDCSHSAVHKVQNLGIR
eukprot:4742588-Amphidinium_carterae.1